jgi:outer membrane protein
MMKRLLILVLSVFMAGGFAFAQKELKIGHVNSNVLVQQLPDFEKAQKTLMKHQKDLEGAMGEMQQELQTKYQAYAAKADSLSPLLRQAKEEEITELQRRVENFRQSAQEDLRKKEMELQQPIITKVQKAIDDVAQENGYTYVLDAVEGGSVLYTAPGSNDLTPLVKKKLGIQ